MRTRKYISMSLSKKIPVDDVHEWFSIMHSGETQQHDVKRFEEWALNNPGSYERFQALERTWAMTKDMVPPSPFNGAIDTKHAARRFMVRRPVRFAAWATTAVAGLFAVFTLSIMGTPDFPTPANYETSVGQLDTVYLSDGSRLKLNAMSEVNVVIDENSRTIELTKGEVEFSVAHDRARPFVVNAGNGFIRAIGTAFNIDIVPDQVRVTVIEGVISVTHPDAGAIQEMTARAGEVVSYGHAGADRTPVLTTLEDLNPVTAWQHGRLIFSGEPLQEVAHKVNRYTDDKIVVDSRVAKLAVFGIFDVDEVDAIYDAIEAALPVRAVRKDGFVYLENATNL